MTLRRPALFICLALSAATAQADWRPDRVFVQAGIAQKGSAALGVGVTWESGWKRPWLGTELSGTLDLMAAGWRWDHTAGGDAHGALLALIPMARLRPDQGRSPWFFEAGIGLSVMDRHYRTPDKTFSTTFNFYDVVGLGRSFGAAREQELSLRLMHISNASIRKPNPGEEFLELRYSRRF